MSRASLRVARRSRRDQVARSSAGIGSASRSWRSHGQPQRAAAVVEDHDGPCRRRLRPARSTSAAALADRGGGRRRAARSRETRVRVSCLSVEPGADEVLDEVVGRAARMSSGVSYCAICAPSWRITIRSPSLIASSMSWVTQTIVLRSSRWMREQLVLQALPGDRVDRAERLVHQDHRRVGGQAAGHADALLLATGELARVAVAVAARVEADQVEQLVDALAILVRVPAEQLRHDRDVLRDGHVREQAAALDHVADRAGAARRRPCSRTSLPPIRIVPEVGSISRLIIFSVVVLPQPEGPTNIDDLARRGWSG